MPEPTEPQVPGDASHGQGLAPVDPEPKVVRPRKATKARRTPTQPPAPEEDRTEGQPGTLTQIRPRFYFFHNGEPRRIETDMQNRIIFYATSTGGREDVQTETLVGEQDEWRAPLTHEGQISDGFAKFLASNSSPDNQQVLRDRTVAFIEHAQENWNLNPYEAANLAIQMAVELHRRAEGSSVEINHSLLTQPFIQEFLTSLRGNEGQSTESITPTPEEDRKVKIVYDVVRAFEMDQDEPTSARLFRRIARPLGDLYDRMNQLIIPVSATPTTKIHPLPRRNIGEGRRGI